jgi:hypothetical protein
VRSEKTIRPASRIPSPIGTPRLSQTRKSVKSCGVSEPRQNTAMKRYGFTVLPRPLAQHTRVDPAQSDRLIAVKSAEELPNRLHPPPTVCSGRAALATDCEFAPGPGRGTDRPSVWMAFDLTRISLSNAAAIRSAGLAIIQPSTGRN